MMRQRWVIGNWKMHGTRAEAIRRVAQLQAAFAHQPPQNEVHCVVCPSFVHLSAVRDVLKSPLALGAQDVSDAADGAFTGQISSSMLTDLGCQYVLIGHSERRAYCHESNTVLRNKFLRAQNAPIIPVLCVGETAAERDRGETERALFSQLSVFLDGSVNWSSAMLAYEPVWAIGTGKTPTVNEVAQVHAFLRGVVAKADSVAARALPILYGGSVKANNAASFMACSDVNGVLVGGASLDAEAFAAICGAV